ncbi:intraflagellar transport protein 22 homolog [Engraulis encrasicolus]|uniref:intraflagellar transport protein 22 homolog n=1 Tax=Engraulis encrasicolus TaxID=184585 RepID=UPI002FD53DE4
MFKTKVLIIGPSESGKTVLANFLSDTVETIGGNYSPTQGVRILEFDSQKHGSGDRDSSCEVELWDCGGDFKFESCWPALMKDSNGVVIVFNADVPSHVREVETWHSTFVASQGLEDSQCLLLVHHKPGSGTDTSPPSLASHLSKLPLVHSNLEEDPEDVRREFGQFLTSVVKTMSENRENEEMSIIT